MLLLHVRVAVHVAATHVARYYRALYVFGQKNRSRAPLPPPTHRHANARTVRLRITRVRAI